MSDTPLFQNADEQEKIYAPQQIAPDDNATTLPTVVPATGGAFQTADVAPGAATETSPVVGAAALAKETEDHKSTDRGTT